MAIKTTFLFVCTNRKVKGKCCALYDSESVYNLLRLEINQKRHLFKDRLKVKPVKTSCLGQCAYGPNIFISPDDVWLNLTSSESVTDLVDNYLVKGIFPDNLHNKLIGEDNAGV